MLALPKKRRGGTASHPCVNPFFSVEYEVFYCTKTTLYNPLSCPVIGGNLTMQTSCRSKISCLTCLALP